MKEIVEPTVMKENENRSSIQALRKLCDEQRGRIELLEVTLLKKDHQMNAFDEIYEKIANKVSQMLNLAQE